jgi:aerobic-type carbon monoxide dehydrogenase small subunit (CoxS/CutS family)
MLETVGKPAAVEATPPAAASASPASAPSPSHPAGAVSASAIAFVLNGHETATDASPARRLTSVLRDDLGLTGTKVGCDAGDCGACTVLVDGEPVCGCLTAVGQVEGRTVETIEGLGDRHPAAKRLQDAFLAHGAAQCGICTPGMLVSATALLEREAAPSEAAVMDAIGGVLCRCTGYRKIVAAVLDAAAGSGGPIAGVVGDAEVGTPEAGAVGRRLARLDGVEKVEGSDIFGADFAPPGTLALRAVRSPFHHARFRLGDIAAWIAKNPGVVRVFTAADVPGENRFGVIPPFADSRSSRSPRPGSAARPWPPSSASRRWWRRCRLAIFPWSGKSLLP